MTVFLTGGSGFVGLALLERLLGEGRTVVNSTAASCQTHYARASRNCRASS